MKISRSDSIRRCGGSLSGSRFDSGAPIALRRFGGPVRKRLCMAYVTNVPDCESADPYDTPLGKPALRTQSADSVLEDEASWPLGPSKSGSVVPACFKVFWNCLGYPPSPLFVER